MFYDKSDDLKKSIMRELTTGTEISFAEYVWELYEKDDSYTIGDVCRAFGELVDEVEVETDYYGLKYTLAPHLRSWFEDADEEFRDAAIADEYVGDLARTAWGDYEDEDEDDEDDE